MEKFYAQKVIVSQKISNYILLPITLPNVDGFSEVNSKFAIKYDDFTTPQTCHYTTL